MYLMNTEVSIFLLAELVLFVLLVIVRAVRILPTKLTSYELKRRAKAKDEKAIHDLRRQNAIEDLATIRSIKDTTISVILVISMVGYLGWLVGGLVSIASLLLASVVARTSAAMHLAGKLYGKYEINFLSIIDSMHPVLKILHIPKIHSDGDFIIHSKEELSYLIENSGDVLSRDERYLLAHAINFQQKPVKDVMTPKAAISSIDKKELLGPLVLDDLHKTGHSRFPVIDGNIDHVIGILHIQSLLTLDKKRSVTAEKAMEAKVHYINQDQTLDHALAAFLRTHHHLFIVVNELQKTVGVLSLEDVIEALLGRKINDEFDTV